METALVSYLQELFIHQEWADAEHWRAIEACPQALKDNALCERLVHIHLVQHAFLWIAGPQTTQFSLKKPEDFPTTSDLKRYGQEGNADLRKLLMSLAPDRLEEVIVVPWFKPPLTISRRHALTQAAMHSHYHRGQNATRLRELGGIPPTTDFIVWLRDGKPFPRWA